ncbi:MAG: hypothetical protein J7M05_05965 [Anaerolineae bacterium]|nr:hypothetical protein [Anaerolineae bacterium]
MRREPPCYEAIARLALEGCPEGSVLEPLRPRTAEEARCFAAWETPLAPWGGFGVGSELAVVHEADGRPVLEFTHASGGGPRSLVTRSSLRDGRITAEIKPLAAQVGPNNDRPTCHEALVGIIFRRQTSRAYYQFGFEGRRRIVLYRRNDQEFFPLAMEELPLPDAYLHLEVLMDGDGLRCRCPELGIDWLCTETTFKRGKVGVRALGRARLAALEVAQTPSQRAREAHWQRRQREEEAQRGEGIPEAVLLYTYDLAELGGKPLFADFAEPGRYDLLVPTPKGLRALTAEGQLLWETPIALHEEIVFSRGHGPHGRLIYGFTGTRQLAKEWPGIRGERFATPIADEMVILQGRDGQVLARAKLPPLEGWVRFMDYSPTSGELTGSGGFDIVLREWRQDKEGGGVNLWAYDPQLHLLWHQKITGAYYGHHWALQFYDVDGDGRDELLAGGVLFDAEGRVLWVHDRAEEVSETLGGHHYDAVAIGALAGDAEVDPVAFLLAGSAGVYIVDALDGHTRAVHRVGHAQGRMLGHLRADLPGTQVLVATRWDNYGILSLFSGRGERLWTIQPDYIGQGACPVQWGDLPEQLLWVNTTGPAQAFYDGHGRLVKRLPAISQLWGGRMRKEILGPEAVRLGKRPGDLLCLGIEGRLYLFGPEE